MAGAGEFERVFERLKGILEPYGRRLHVSADDAEGFGVDLAPEGERDPSTWFAGARIWTRYVSYYLMPVYVEPALLEGMSPELRRRMQGKCCFNFTRVDEALFDELEGLTKRGFDRTGGNPGWGVARREATSRAPKR